MVTGLILAMPPGNLYSAYQIPIKILPKSHNVTRLIFSFRLPVRLGLKFRLFRRKLFIG